MFLMRLSSRRRKESAKIKAGGGCRIVTWGMDAADAGACGPSWVLMGRALMGLPGPLWLGPHGPAPRWTYWPNVWIACPGRWPNVIDVSSTYIYIYVYMSICIYTIYICIYICIYKIGLGCLYKVCIYKYIHICIYIHVSKNQERSDEPLQRRARDTKCYT